MNDYTWKVLQSGNPNKAWIVDMQLKKKISALMSTTSARNLATAHNMIVGYLQQTKG